MATRVIIVRHGESTYNVEGRVQGHCDKSVLTPRGEAMASAVGQALHGISFDAIYSSPFQRAKRTATLAIANFKSAKSAPALIDCDDLKEVDIKLWEEMKFTDIEAKYPTEMAQWKSAPHELHLVGTAIDGTAVDVYPFLALYEQAERFWKSTIPKHPNQTIMLVAHSAINRALINTAIGLTAAQHQRIEQSNCCISVLNFSDQLGDPVQIESLNITAHLGTPLPKPKHDQVKRLLLVRHGETNWNRDGRFQGQIDIPLNENGQRQGEQAGDFLRDVKIDAAVTSSMLRPKETAELILKHHPGVELQGREDLWEISHGTWEGKLESEIRATDGPLLDAWQAKPETVQMPEGENLDDVFKRAIGAWNDIATQTKPGTTTLVVAHDAINKAILCHVTGIGPEAFWNFKQGNGAVSVIDYANGSDRPPVLRAANITVHLGGVLDKTAAGAL
jgi:phosphoserine phosphatase